MLKAAGIYLLLAIAFPVGSVTAVPVLMTVNFLCSLATILLSLVSLQPAKLTSLPVRVILNIMLLPPRRLLVLIQYVHGKSQFCLILWFGFMHVFFIFPLSMLTLVVSSIVVPRIEQSADYIGCGLASSIEFLGIDRAYSFISLQKRSVTRRIRHIIDWLGLQFPFSHFESLVWVCLNSPVADTFMLSVIQLRHKVHLVQKAATGLLAVLSMAVMYQRKATEPQLWLITQQLQAVLYPVMLLLSPFWFLYERTKLSRDEELSIAQTSNSAIYKDSNLAVCNIKQTGANDHHQRVRLLRLLAGHDEQGIECQLYVADLNDPASCDYEALSYVWGPPDLSLLITINGESFRISRSLEHTLRLLRYETRPRVLWIDAICINQSDIPERNSQVLLMRRIYSQAASVVECLGNTAPWGLQRVFQADLQRLDSEMHYAATRAISDLLSRPWWTRVWTVQELVLARHAKVACGSYVIKWEDFCRLVETCASRPYFLRTAVHLEEFYAFRDNRRERLRQIPDGGITPDGRISRATDLLSLLYDFRGRRSTEPRDKVFAYLGLAWGRHLHIQPEYGQLYSKLSVDLARAHINTSRSLTAVALAEVLRQKTPRTPSHTNEYRVQYVPSWCPAFMNDEAVQDGLNHRPFWTDLPHETAGSAFSAAGNIAVRPLTLVPQPSGTGDANFGYAYKLVVEILTSTRSEIVAVGLVSTVTLSDMIETTKDVLIGQAASIAGQLQRRIWWKKVLPAWRALAEDSFQQRDQQVTHISQPQPRLSVEQLFTLTITAGRFSAPDTRTKLSQSSESYDDTLESVCANRQFFVTKDGYFGLGPRGLRAGDELDVMIGSQAPVIIRRAQSHFEEDGDYVSKDETDFIYVGQAYVHELMVYDGDLDADIESGAVKTEERLLM